jgi:hypothetical protein
MVNNKENYKKELRSSISSKSLFLTYPKLSLSLEEVERQLRVTLDKNKIIALVAPSGCCPEGAHQNHYASHNF